MSAPEEPRDDAPLPPPRADPAATRPCHGRPSPRRAHYSLWLVWLVPLVAVIIGVGLGVRSILNRGPRITIYFHNAEGLEANKTHIKYKDVDIGIVRRVALTKDHREVEVSAEMRGNSGIENLLVTDTRFWIVRPRIGAAGVSGLGTLLSGAYIGMDAGRNATEKREFEGLDVQPAITADVPGREFTLVSDDLGSLDIGSPIYLRRVPGGPGTRVHDAARRPAHQVHDLHHRALRTASSARTAVSGTPAASTSTSARKGCTCRRSRWSACWPVASPSRTCPDPDNALGTPPEAAERTQFTLYAQMSDALKLPDSQGFDYRLLFASSVRGLALGAPVEYRGLPIGEVTRIAVDGSSGEANPEPLIAVDVRVYPRRLPTINKSGPEDMTLDDQRKRIDPMVRRGFRGPS